MKNVLIVVLIAIVILVAFGLIETYDLVEWKWKQMAILAAALGGPFQFFYNKYIAKKEEKEENEAIIKYKTLDYKYIQSRRASANATKKENTTPESSDFDINESTVG